MSSLGFWKPEPVQPKKRLRQDVVFNNDYDYEEDYVNSNNSYNNNNNNRGDKYSIQQQRLLLPIYKHKTQILYALEHYNVIIIVGETGCGKTTQIPQYLIEDGGWATQSNEYQIVCTQPRRISAITLAQRVAYEMNTMIGNEVGYAVRFDEKISSQTLIKYVTDGMLLREATLYDPYLSNYSVIIIDEAHERTIQTDALFGLLKKIRIKRPTLRIIICSATIDATIFFNYFFPKNKNKKNSSIGTQKESKIAATITSTKTTNAAAVQSIKSTTMFDEASKNDTSKRIRKRRWDNPATDTNQKKNVDFDFVTNNNINQGTIISVDGRQYPVDVLHLQQPCSDYIETMVELTWQIINNNTSNKNKNKNDVYNNSNNNDLDGGDILCFLPSGEQIDQAIHIAEERYYYNNNNVDLLPLYGNLPYHMQAQVFQQNNNNNNKTSGSRSRRRRRIIFATNIAETSVTVPNVTYVIDSGLVKLPYYDPQTNLERLIVCPISQASAIQRTGRAGRIGIGQCYRLYTEKFMRTNMIHQTPPEIVRTNLGNFILALKALGIDNILAFDLIDIPSIDSLSNGLEALYALNAIDDKTNLTKDGTIMSTFPTEPRISRMLLSSINEQCSWEVLAVASALQVRDLLHKPRGRQNNQQLLLDYEQVISDIADPSGDHVSYVNLFADMDDNHYNEQECRDKFINYNAIRRGIEIRNQLARYLKKFGRIQSIGLMNARSTHGSGVDATDIRSEKIRRCVTSGFFTNVAKLANDGRYYTLRKPPILVTPSSSSLFTGPSEYIIYGETIDGVRGGIELKSVSAIEAKWLRELAHHYWE